MRVIVMYDLPNSNPAENKNYVKFVTFLKKHGFLRLQYSVYSRLALNDSSARYIYSLIERNKPSAGQVIIFSLTEIQFSKMIYINESRETEVIDTSDKVIVL